MSTHGWLRIRRFTTDTPARVHRRDRGRRRRPATLGSGPPRLEGLEDRTLLASAVVSTLAASGVSATGATLNGTVNPESNTISAVTFQYATNPYLAPSVVGTFPSSGTGSTTITGAQGVAVDPATGDVFVADTGQDTILMITPSGTVSTIAGTPGTAGSANGAGNGAGGTGNVATFNAPSAIAFDPANGDLFVADKGNNAIRMLTPSTSGGGAMPYTVSTLAGTGASGAGASATFSGPMGIAVNPGQGTGGTVYVADTGNNVVDAIDIATGTVTPLAGTGASGAGASASFSGPQGIAVDPSTNNIYVADTGHNVIDMITPSGTTSLVAGTSGTAGTTDGLGSSALFNAPTGVAVDPNTGLVYVSDSGNNSIRLIASAASGSSGSEVSTLAGTSATGSAGAFTDPVGLVVDPAMNRVYVANAGGNTIEQLSTLSATASPMPTATGGTQLISAQATGLSPSTTYYYRAAATTSGSTRPVLGNIVSFTTASTSAPTVSTQPATNVTSTAATLNGTLVSSGGTAIGAFQYATNRYLAPSVVSNFPSSGTGSTTIMGAQGAAVDPATGDVFVADTGQDTILMITPSGTVSTIAGIPGTAGSANGAGNGAGGTGNVATFNAPSAIAFDPANGDLFVADKGNNAIRMLTPSTSGGGAMPYTVSTLAGTGASGAGASATFSGPMGIAVNPGQGTGGTVYVADTGNNVVDAIDIATDTVTPLAGKSGTAGSADGTGTAATFNRPEGLAVDTTTGNVFVADTGNSTIRMITPAGVVSTLAGTAGTTGSADGSGGSGTGSAALFNAPTGVAVDPTTDLVYVADTGNNTIRLVTPTGAVSTLAGTAGTTGAANGAGGAASFSSPMGLAFNPTTDQLFVTDSGNGAIRELSVATLAAQTGTTGSSGTPLSAQATGLSPNTTYYYRAIATTSGSTRPTLGNIVSFTTVKSTANAAPTATTQAATDITGTTATLNATVNPKGGDTNAYFVYGTDSTLKTNTTRVPIAGLSLAKGTTDVAVKEPVSGLSPNTTYYFEIVASNAAGTTTGNILSFATTAQTVVRPAITTVPASNVTTTAATVAASVNPDGAATTVSFVYGTTPTLASNTQTTAAQSIGSGTTAVPVTASLTNLRPGTIYYYEAMATSNGVTTPGPIASFTTAKVTTVSRFGYHNQPTAYVLHYNEAVNPAWAGNVANYELIAMAGRGRHSGVAQVARGGDPIKIASAVYDAANHTVRLTTAQRVYLYGTYELVVRGGSSTTIGGAPGATPAVAGINDPIIIRESDLAGPNFARSMNARTRARLIRSWPHERAYAAGVMMRIDAARAAAAFRTAHHGTAAVRVHHATATPARAASTSATAQAGGQSAAVDAAITSLVVSSKAQHQKR